MLTIFYTAHNSAWINTEDNFVLVKKLDSLQKKYCSLRFQKVIKKEFKLGGLDHDLLTNDEGADANFFKTLKVEKDKVNQNVYSVSYTYHTKDPSYRPIDKKVILHVTVVKEGDSYKIDSVR